MSVHTQLRMPVALALAAATLVALPAAAVAAPATGRRATPQHTAAAAAVPAPVVTGPAGSPAAKPPVAAPRSRLDRPTPPLGRPAITAAQQAAAAAAAVPVVPGIPFTATLTAAEPVQSFTFTGARGQRIVLTHTGGTITGSPTVVARDPRGVVRFSGRPFPSPADGGSGFLELGVIQVAGTWTLDVESGAPVLGTADLVLSLVRDTTAAVTPGVGRSLAVRTPGVNARLTFTGVVGTRPVLVVSRATLTELNGFATESVYLLRPDGTQFANLGTLTEADPLLAHAQFDEALDMAGTWTILFDPFGAATATHTLTLDLVTDRRETIAVGVPSTVALGQFGQNVYLSFPGVAGRRGTVDLNARNLTGILVPQSRPVTLGLYLDGAPIGGGFLGDEQTYTDLDPVLPAGAASLLVSTPAVGSITITLHLVQDVTGALPLGTATPLDLGTAGANHSYRFTAQGGRRLGVRFTGITLSSGPGTFGGTGLVSVAVLDQNGATLGQHGVSGVTSGDAWMTDVLPAGRYTLLVDPLSDTVGALTMRAAQPADLVRAVTPGATTTVTLAVGQNARLTFPGVAGRRVSLSVSRADYPLITQDDNASGRPPTHVLLRPDGSFFGTSGPDTLPFRYGESDRDLDVTGTWTMLLGSTLITAGTETFVLRLVTDQVSAITPGADLPVRVAVPGRNVRLTFAATAGQRLVLQFRDQAWRPVVLGGAGPAELRWRLLRPDGTPDFDRTAPPTTSGQGEGVVDVSGSWTLVLDPVADAIGSVTIRLTQVADPRGTLPVGAAASVAVAEPGQNPVYTFAGRAGQHLVVRYGAFGLSNEFAAAGEQTGARITLLRPDGTGFAVAGPDLAAGVRFAESSFLFGPDRLLDVTGTWSLVVDGFGATVGTQPLTLQLVPDVQVPATAGQPVTVTITRPGQNVALVLDVPAGATDLTWTATGSTFAQARLRASATPPPVGRPIEDALPPGDSTGGLNQWSGPATAYVQVDPLGGATGTVTITLRFVPVP